MYIFKITEFWDLSYLVLAKSYTDLIEKLQELNKNIPQQIEIIAEQTKEWEEFFQWD